MAAIISGCDSGSNDQPTKKAAAIADKELSVAIKAAQSVRDPWEAFKQLDAAETTILRKNNPCADGKCESVPAWDQSATMRVKYLSSAIEANRPEAFSYLYGHNGGDSVSYNALRESSVAKLLAYAEQAPGGAADGPVFFLAGQFVAGGNNVVRDTSRAVGFYARAWAVGEKQAANSAAALLLGINDVRNAYLWSLRCTAPCQRDPYVSLSQLESLLSPEAAKQAQKAAGTESVVELDTAGG